ncbi:hypothetical protein ABW19_dt0208701 [Dactylella cylindrospora]|nr:hypothetical protein ABW19_dt0208701 [Dactylella cylindrospora]
MAQTTQVPIPASLAAKATKSVRPSDPSIPPEDSSESPFLSTFLSAGPVAAEIISLLPTAQKQHLFATCRALSAYRDTCYAWRSVTFVKNGYEPQTSFAKINYQTQARISAQGRYISLPNEKEVKERAEREGWYAVKPVENYFCPELDSAKLWSMFSLRPGFGTVLSELVLDGTRVDMPFVVKIMAICDVSGKGLKRLSLRYCDKITLSDIVELIPKEIVDDTSDSGFESQSEGETEFEDDSVLRTLRELQIYGIGELSLGIQEYRAWLTKLDLFFKYTNEKKIRSDIGWCSQTLQGPKKRLPRSQCHGGRELPFIKILPLADTGSARKINCMKCKKGPEEIGWHCDGCLKEVLCDVCGDFLCDICDPKRQRLVKCGDCPARRCSTCFEENGGTFCSNLSCKSKPTCGAHNFEMSCNTCSESKKVSCSACNPARKCKKCTVWIYSHCDDSKKNEAFRCDCDFELCHDCCETAKAKFVKSNMQDGSLEEIVYAMDSSDYPIVPRRLKDMDEDHLRDNSSWCCFYCKIMPRRRERFTEQRRDRSIQRSTSRRRSR